MKKTALALPLIVALLIPSVANAEFTQSYSSTDPEINYTHFLLTVYSPDNNQTCKGTLLLNFTVNWREYPTFAGLPSPPAPVMKGLYSYTIDNNTAVAVASNQSSADQFDLRGFKVNPTFSYLLDVSNLTNGYHEIVITVGLTDNYDDIARYINKDTPIQFFVAQTEGTIYIRADGTVEGTDNIQREGNVYTFTTNIFGEIKVQRGDCVIDGAGYTLQGTWTGYDPNNYVYSKGIDLSNDRMSQPSRPTISNVTIKNLRIVNFLRGIEGVNSNNNTIINCYIADCGRGINQPSNFLIANNTLASGIFIDYTNADNVITQNNMMPEGVYEEYPAASLVGVFLAEQPTVYMNYWSDYNGTDADGDGIGDTPYVINEDNQDSYPLMNPVEPTFIPEFPSWIVLLFTLVAVVAVTVIYRRKLSKSKER